MRPLILCPEKRRETKTCWKIVGYVLAGIIRNIPLNLLMALVILFINGDRYIYVASCDQRVGST